MAEQRNIPADLVEIGTLARPHGIRGEIRVNYYADSLELLRGDVVYLQAGNKPPRKMEIDTVRMHQGTPLIRFVEAPDRTAAEFLRGQTLLIPESALPELDEDEVYLHDMLGLSVVLDATGQKLGVLDHVLFHGEQELWSILTPEGKEMMDQYCEEVNLTIDEYFKYLGEQAPRTIARQKLLDAVGKEYCEEHGLTFTKVNPPKEMIDARDAYVAELFAQAQGNIIYYTTGT